MEITIKLKERFCKDCRIPIKLFDEPYFSQRLEILNANYNSKAKWEQFLKCLERYDSEQDFFEDYNRVKDEMINFIKNSEGYQKFNNCDMNQYTDILNKYKLPKGLSKDIYRPSNVGKVFISLDIKKANFAALKHYGGILDEFNTYEDFVSKFTDNPHFIESKYIREVIFGNCNPSRHITYEKYIMYKFLDFLLESSPLLSSTPEDILSRLVSLSNDEIIFTTSYEDSENEIDAFKKVAESFKEKENIDFKIEFFILYKISGDAECYIKSMHYPETALSFKCCNANNIHLILKYLSCKEITEDDLTFFHEGKLAKYLSPPNLKIQVEQEN